MFKKIEIPCLINCEGICLIKHCLNLRLYNCGCPAGADERMKSVLWSQPFRPAVLWLTELDIRLSKNFKFQLLLVVDCDYY